MISVSSVFWECRVKRNTATLVCCMVLIVACFGQDRDKSAPRIERSARSVTIVEFADFQCPFCARQAPDLRKLQSEYSSTLTLTFRNFPLPFHKRSRPAHLAALAAGDQGKFWEMHDLIFAHPGHLSPEDFDQYAAQLGLDKDKFAGSLTDPVNSTVIDKDFAEGRALGVNSTPTFVVNGHKLAGKQSYARLKQIIEAELNGEPWHAPERANVDLTGAPFQGPESAPVTIVEFSDFQCPFCARAVPSLQRLLAANQGKVRFVFKNFPLDSHLDSHLAHMAALAAEEQGKFWEMHNLIFAHPHTIKRADLVDFAAQLHLDMDRFQSDLENPKLKTKIDRDKTEGEQLGVTATPTFLVNGESVSGFSSGILQAKIDARLSPIPTQPVALPKELAALDLSLGPKDAPLKVLWYADLTSPLTAQSAVALQHFLAAHSGHVQVEFKSFPLRSHSQAMLVHEFALAAAAQGKFWPVEALLLADSRPKDREELRNVATQAELDQSRLWAEVDAHKYAPFILRDLLEAKRAGVSGTPTFVVGDKRLDGVNGLATLP